MIVFVITEFNELRIVKAEHLDIGIRKVGGIGCKSFGRVADKFVKRMLEEDFIICIPLESED